MSKCQKNKYAAGGRCGTMGSCGGQKNPEQVGCKPLSSFGEVNTNLAALIASRERQDALLFSTTSVHPTEQKQNTLPVAIVSKNKAFSKSDIDTVLEGDF